MSPTPFTKQSELAHEARELIVRMAGTNSNLTLVLDGLITAVQDVSCADMSEVLEKLGDAMLALQEVRAYEASEMADWTREAMRDERRVA
jgi:hypothetical protein